MSELSGSLAHELNQPLAIILSNAQAAQRLLAQAPPDLAEVRDILTDIVAEDRRAGEVIRRLRALLKRGETVLVRSGARLSRGRALHRQWRRSVRRRRDSGISTLISTQKGGEDGCGSF